MPLQKLQFRPGVVRDLTRNAGSGNWFDCDKIRFRNGMPEKIGGWTKLTSSTYDGECRALFNWNALDASDYMAVGTAQRYYIEEGGSLYNITPYRTAEITLGANPLKTGSAASGEITVTHTAHGAVLNDFVTFSGAATVDGVTAAQINLTHQITTLIDSNSYKIITDGSASSGSTSGGGSSVVVRYEINTGLDTGAPGVGWGAGLYGGLSIGYSETTLSSDINTSVATIPLTSASDFETVSTTLSAAFASTDVTAFFSDVSSFPDQGSFLVDSERIIYGNRDTSTNTVSDLTRAADGTTKAAHSSGATVTFVGLVLIGTELITYTAKSGDSLTSAVRGVRGTTAAAGSDGDSVKEANDFIAWDGSAATTVAEGQGLRLWSQDNFGEDLLYNVRDGAIYYWDKTTGTNARGVNLTSVSGSSGCPTVCRQVMVSNNDRHVLAFGCNDIGSGTQDKLLIRWGNQESLTDWTPTTANTAGDLRINNGSEILATHETRQEILVWTDASLHSVRYVGPPFTFGQTVVTGTTTLISARAMATLNDTTMWMGSNNFYAYNGRTQTLPCTVRAYVFDDINFSERQKIFASTNSQFNEVMWFYVSNGSSEIDKYVVYNTEEQAWYFGSLARTAWVDRTSRDYPIAANGDDNYLYYHDKGFDDGSTSPVSSITAYIESADFEIGEGDNFQFVRRIIPDLSFIGSTNDAPVATMTLKPRNFPGEDYGTSGSGSVTASQVVDVEQFTNQAFIRLRGRAMAFRVESSGSGIHWRLGAPRIEVRPDGRR
jgi:hypothetical protein